MDLSKAISSLIEIYDQPNKQTNKQKETKRQKERKRKRENNSDLILKKKN